MARPKEYDRMAVLTEAMNVFWGTGYFGTSLAQLIDATRLKPGSLYGAFHSKEDLFLAALDLYGAMSVENVREILQCTPSPLDGLREWIRKVVREVANHQSHGCLLVNTAIELSSRNPAIRGKVNGYFDEIRGLIVSQLEKSKNAGEISEDKDPASLGSFILCLLYGLRVMGETCPEASSVKSIEAEIFRMLES